MARSTTRETTERPLEKLIFGTPARLMRPRIIFIVVSAILVAFGLLMIYSASSITAQTSTAYNYDAFYFVSRQARAALIGLVLAIVLARIDYHVWMTPVLYGIWGFTVILLILVLTSSAGQDAYGATRWISIGGFNFQPSEFTKVTLILVAAWLLSRYFESHELDFEHMWILTLVMLLPPALFILFQPDKGTTALLAFTILVMAILAGVPWKILGIVALAGVLLFVVVIFRDSYALARFFTASNPWADPLDSGYQLIQGFYAFGSGGLTGVGLGLSAQKYSYLPMAHNDFIFAIIGEELGLLGTLGVIAAFIVLFLAGIQIANEARDMSGKLIVCGSITLTMAQFFLNISGVLGIAPLTGKPIPFLSYGGSTLLSTLMLVGIVLSVSIHSELPDPAREVRSSWTLVEGSRSEQQSGSRIRIDLGPTSAERLRGNDRSSRDSSSSDAGRSTSSSRRSSSSSTSSLNSKRRG